MPEAALHAVYDERLRFNPGAERWSRPAEAAGLKTLLVSGGFTFFTDRVRDRLASTATRSNVLEIADGALTGRMVDQPWGDICDGDEKRRAAAAGLRALGIDAGSGDRRRRRRQRPADDGRGRLSVAYHAKPTVREAGDGGDHRRRARPPARDRSALSCQSQRR